MKRSKFPFSHLLGGSVINYSAYLLCALFTVAGTLISLHRFWQYESSFTDFGVFDQIIWRVSRFEAPITYHFILGEINFFGDHVVPSIFLISPLYWITDRSEIILVVQALAVGLSGLFLYDLANHVLKNKLLSLSVLVSYLLFAGLQNAVITDFHELTVMTLPLMMTFWAVAKERKCLYFISLILTLGFKEITFALGISIGIVIFFLKPRWRKIAVLTVCISILWALICFMIIIPSFSHGKYLYSSSLPDTPVEMITGFVDHQQKRSTLFFSFLSFSFLSLFAPQFWATLVQDYAIRFLPENFVTRWGLGMHYNAQTAVLLAVSSVYGLHYLFNKYKLKKFASIIAVLITINAIFLYRFVLHGPFALSYNTSFYSHTQDFSFLNAMVSKIPENAVVMTQNNLATRFTHQKVYLLREYYNDIKPDYVLFDLREGQNPNNYFGGDDVRDVVYAVENDINYTVIYETEDQRIYRRKR